MILAKKQLVLGAMRDLFGLYRVTKNYEIFMRIETENRANFEELRSLILTSDDIKSKRSLIEKYKPMLPSRERAQIELLYSQVNDFQFYRRYRKMLSRLLIIILILSGCLYFPWFLLQDQLNPSFEQTLKAFSIGIGKTFGNDNEEVRFREVIGCDEAVAELKQVCEMIKFPKKYKEKGVILPKGILLTGPPGTGKTMLAKALATESGANFFYCSASEFEEMFVGLGSKRIRDLFSKARRKAPAIIFIDEIDSIGGKRDPKIHRFYRQSINQILTEMDGFREDDNILVLGATNLVETLDAALTRSGRFDKTVNLTAPGLPARKELLRLFTKKKKLDSSFDFEVIGRRTMGMTGADLKNLVNIAAINSVRNNQNSINIENFDYAFNQVLMGVRSQRGAKDFSDYERKAIAIHETGHTIINLLGDGLTNLYKVTILPAGGSLGHTAMTPKQDFVSYTKENILNQVDIKLGGRAAEEIYLGKDKVTSGCGSDFNRATQELYQYIRDMGMEENQFIQSRKKSLISDRTNHEIDTHVDQLLKTRYEIVKHTIINNAILFNAIFNELVEKETLTAEDISKIRERINK